MTGLVFGPYLIFLPAHLLMRTPSQAHTAGLAFIVSGPAELLSLTVISMSVLTALVYIDSSTDDECICRGQFVEPVLTFHGL